MKILSRLFDKRINAWNILLEIKIEDYIQLAIMIIQNNEFQRKRVKSSSSVYSLLKTDLQSGCIIPPIVLALSDSDIELLNLHEAQDEQLVSIIKNNNNQLLILDGLQRTYTILELERDLKNKDDIDLLKTFHKSTLRIEIYLGLNKIGILYRMLTLNTGQTPMSIRHQIEILYSSFLNKPLDGIRLITEKDDTTPESIYEYKFKDVIEGFNSYLERNELTIDRQDLLDNIISLEKLSKENQNTDLFECFLNTFHFMILKIFSLAMNWEFDKNSIEYNMTGTPFGKNVINIFKKSQVMTGFGSAIGKLFDFDEIKSFNEIKERVNGLKFESNPENGLNNLIIKLDKIRLQAKKIGNEQRIFFHYLFRELFDRKGDGYLILDKAIQEAYKTYERKTL